MESFLLCIVEDIKAFLLPYQYFCPPSLPTYSGRNGSPNTECFFYNDLILSYLAKVCKHPKTYTRRSRLQIYF